MGHFVAGNSTSVRLMLTHSRRKAESNHNLSVFVCSGHRKKIGIHHVRGGLNVRNSPAYRLMCGGTGTRLYNSHGLNLVGCMVTLVGNTHLNVTTRSMKLDRTTCGRKLTCTGSHGRFKGTVVRFPTICSVLTVVGNGLSTKHTLLCRATHCMSVCGTLSSVTHRHGLAPRRHRRRGGCTGLTSDFAPLTGNVGSRCTGRGTCSYVRVRNNSNFVVRCTYRHVCHSTHVADVCRNAARLRAMTTVHCMAGNSCVTAVHRFRTVPYSPRVRPLVSHLGGVTSGFRTDAGTIGRTRSRRLLSFATHELVRVTTSVVVSRLLVRSTDESSRLFSGSTRMCLGCTRTRIRGRTGFVDGFSGRSLTFCGGWRGVVRHGN